MEIERELDMNFVFSKEQSHSCWNLTDHSHHPVDNCYSRRSKASQYYLSIKDDNKSVTFKSLTNSLSYVLNPSAYPKYRSALLVASVTASFFAFLKN